jgi:hypothetical protein
MNIDATIAGTTTMRICHVTETIMQIEATQGHPLSGYLGQTPDGL